MKVLTLNLRFTANRWPERFPMIVDLIHQEQPDFVGLQEVALKVQQAHLIQGALNYLNPSRLYKLRVANDTFEPAILANAMLSRYPIQEHERICLPHNFRIAHRIRITVDDQDVYIANTHLHHKPYRDESIRLPQMQAVVDWMSETDLPTILMGDFNARPETETIAYARNFFKSAYQTANQCEPDQTFPTPLIDEDYKPRTIDYIFHSGSNLSVESAKLIANIPHPDDSQLYPSDHFGICAQFRISNH